MNKKHFQKIADLAMPSIVKGPSAYGQADPTKDIIVTTRREGNKIIRNVQYPNNLEALINLMPETIEVNKSKWYGKYDFRLDKDGISYVCDDDKFYHFLKRDYNDSYIETAVAVLEWLLDNGYISE